MKTIDKEIGNIIRKHTRAIRSEFSDESVVYSITAGLSVQIELIDKNNKGVGVQITDMHNDCFIVHNEKLIFKKLSFSKNVAAIKPLIEFLQEQFEEQNFYDNDTVQFRLKRVER